MEYYTKNATSQAALIGAITLLVVYSVRALYRAFQLPPGPWGLPLLGCLPWLDINHFDESEELMRLKYGPIYSFRAGQRLMIVVSSHDLMRDMLKEEVFSGRLVPPKAQQGAKGCGIIFTEGRTWTEQRRVCLRVLRDFGFGKTQSIEVINDEVSRALASLELSSSNIETAFLFSPLSNGVVATLLFGRRYANEDDRFDQFVRDLNTLMSSSISAGLPLLFPTFAPLLGLFGQSKQLAIAAASMTQFVEEEIEQRESLLSDSDTEPLCVCDAYIQERRRAEANGDYETYKPFHLVRVCLEMFIAGTETTARSLQWLLAQMAAHPQVQSNVHQEIQRVVGSERRPQLSDRQQLHYTQAVIDESLRFASLAFNSVSHRALSETWFKGFRIPTDAVIVPFVFGANRDPAAWSKPNEFYPEHFLDSEGRYCPSKRLMSFSTGKRVCPGETLSKLEIFHAFTAVMQRFSVELSESSTSRSAEIFRGKTGSTRQAGEHRINFSRR